MPKAGLGFTFPLVLDLRPGTVRCKSVSERQLASEAFMAPASSSLRELWIRASMDDGVGVGWFLSAIVEHETVEKYFEFDFAVTNLATAEKLRWLWVGNWGLRVLGGFKTRIASAITQRRNIVAHFV